MFTLIWSHLRDGIMKTIKNQFVLLKNYLRFTTTWINQNHKFHKNILSVPKKINENKKIFEMNWKKLIQYFHNVRYSLEWYIVMGLGRSVRLSSIGRDASSELL